MNAIFLDVDGVLNCRDSDTIPNTSLLGIDTEKVLRLKKIVEATDSKIILSSSWKYGWSKDNKEGEDFDAKYLDRIFAENGVEVFDKIEGFSEERGQMIHKYINENDVENWIAIDDTAFEDFDSEILSRLVHTTWDAGLTEEKTEFAIRLFKEKEKTE